MRRITAAALSTGIATTLVTIAATPARRHDPRLSLGCTRVVGDLHLLHGRDGPRLGCHRVPRIDREHAGRALRQPHHVLEDPARDLVAAVGHPRRLQVLERGDLVPRARPSHGSSTPLGSRPRTAGLKPPTPTGVTGHDTGTGSYLTWNGQSTGSGFVVARATTPP